MAPDRGAATCCHPPWRDRGNKSRPALFYSFNRTKWKAKVKKAADVQPSWPGALAYFSNGHPDAGRKGGGGPMSSHASASLRPRCDGRHITSMAAPTISMAATHSSSLPSSQTSHPSFNTGGRDLPHGQAPAGAPCDSCQRLAEWMWSGLLFCGECARHEVEGGL